MTFLTHLTDAQLQRLISGDLVEVESNAARAHLDDCAVCRRRASDVSTLFALLAESAAQPEPPLDFLSAVMARIELESPVPVFVSRRSAIRGLAAGLVAIGAGAALVVTGGSGADLPEMAAGFASTLVGIVSHAGLAVTVVKAGAPVLGGAAITALAIVAPIFWKTLNSLQPNAQRATARS